MVESWPTRTSTKCEELFALKYIYVPNFDIGGGI